MVPNIFQVDFVRMMQTQSKNLTTKISEFLQERKTRERKETQTKDSQFSEMAGSQESWLV